MQNKSGSWQAVVETVDAKKKRRSVAMVYHHSSEEMVRRRAEAVAIAVLMVHHGQLTKLRDLRDEVLGMAAQDGQE